MENFLKLKHINIIYHLGVKSKLWKSSQAKNCFTHLLRLKLSSASLRSRLYPFSTQKYLKKTLLHKDRVQWFARLAGHLQHGDNVVVPEHPVGRVNLGNVAEQLLRVDLGEDKIVLEVAEAIEEKL